MARTQVEFLTLFNDNGWLIPTIKLRPYSMKLVKLMNVGQAKDNLLTLTDLLMRTAQMLKKLPRLRQYFQSQFQYILVDEFQDTDPVQTEILMYLCSQNTEEKTGERLFPNGSLFIVGDPKQSIYRFRRADISIYRNRQSSYSISWRKNSSLNL